jgi:(p)ppGpp synthase/HD superfamily hydrolase
MTGVASLNQQAFVERLCNFGVWSKDTSEALALAVDVHHDQRRAGGGPYLEEHVFPVTIAAVDYISHVKPDEAKSTALVAIMHDAVEDSSPSTAEVIVERFGESIAGAVSILTKPGKSQGESSESNSEDEARYVAGVAGAAHFIRVIKVFDRLNNLASLHKRTPEQRRKYLAETRAYYLEIARSVDASLAGQMAELVTMQETSLDSRSAS